MYPGHRNGSPAFRGSKRTGLPVQFGDQEPVEMTSHSPGNGVAERNSLSVEISTN